MLLFIFISSNFWIYLTGSDVLIVSTNEMTDWMLEAKSLTLKCVSDASVLRWTGHADEKPCLTDAASEWKNNSVVKQIAFFYNCADLTNKLSYHISSFRLTLNQKIEVVYLYYLHIRPDLKSPNLSNEKLLFLWSCVYWMKSNHPAISYHRLSSINID